MSVTDASVFVDATTAAGPAGESARAALEGQPVLQVPAVFEAEVVSALRSRLARGEIAAGRAQAARGQLTSVQLLRYPFAPFSERIWELRANLSVYDAWYVSLAEWLGTSLLTADERLARAPGPHCAVQVVGGDGDRAG